MNGGVPIARILGIEIRVSIAWVVLIALITVVGAQQAAIGSPAVDPIVQWAVGVVVAMLFFVSVLAHELAHALVGAGRGVPTTVIALGFVGGPGAAVDPGAAGARRAGDRARRARPCRSSSARLLVLARDAPRPRPCRRRRRSPAGSSWSAC